MMNLEQMAMSGPIPGESLTRAPRNSPWEKPPQFTQVDDAINHILKQFQNKQTVHKFLALMEAGAPLDTIVGTLLQHGFAEGMWTPSLSMLLMAPITMFLTRLVKQAGIKYVPSRRGSGDKTLDTLFNLIQKKQSKDKNLEPEVKKFQTAVKDYKSSGSITPSIAAPAPPAGGLMSPTAAAIS